MKKHGELRAFVFLTSYQVGEIVFEFFLGDERIEQGKESRLFFFFEQINVAQEQKKTTYNLSYVYGSEQPHTPVHIGDNTYSYDANGNQTGWKDDKTGQRRQIMWDACLPVGRKKIE